MSKDIPKKSRDRAALAWTDANSPISLWALMQVINAETLYRLGMLSGTFDGLCQAVPANQVKDEIPRSIRDNMRSILPKHREVCNEANLHISVMAIDELMATLEDIDSFTFADLTAVLNELSNTVRRELASTTVLCLNPKRSEFYKSTSLFGAEVATNFPSTAYDIEEAGNCLATERATAAVFHLVRVIEVGLRALGKTLNEQHLDPNRNPTWEAILTRCDAELKKPRKDRSPDWQTDEAFYVEATARLRSVKDAWRNPTMHVDKKYTPDESQDIYNAVRTFMRHLATKLKE